MAPANPRPKPLTDEERDLATALARLLHRRHPDLRPPPANRQP